MTVLVAREGEHALSMIERVTPDIILMDAVMPGIDGFETCRRLKQNKALAPCAGHLHDRPERNRARRPGTGRRRRRLRHQADRARTSCWRASACISPMRASRTAHARRLTRSAAFCWRRTAPAGSCGERRRRAGCWARPSGISTRTQYVLPAQRAGLAAAMRGRVRASSSHAIDAQGRCLLDQAGAIACRPDRARTRHLLRLIEGDLGGDADDLRKASSR